MSKLVFNAKTLSFHFHLCCPPLSHYCQYPTPIPLYPKLLISFHSHFTIPNPLIPYTNLFPHITYKSTNPEVPQTVTVLTSLNSLDNLQSTFPTVLVYHSPFTFDTHLVLKDKLLFSPHISAYTCYTHCKAPCQRQIHHMSKNMSRIVIQPQS